MVKLFVAGIPDNLQEIGLIEMFSLYALVSSITVVTDKQSGKSLGYGFIEVQDMAAAGRAIEALNGLKVGARKLEVKIAEERNKPISKRPQERPAQQNSSAALKNNSQQPVQGRSKRPRVKSGL
ncbi:MAG TPA: RNA-binding protein [Pedobacter sp.]|uniref:RNA recognition motif domain-containing protein n=1 Tax=Pedobacter sp. TaxID=1411316 RepID=UPI002C8EB0BC|nr:RNA-binding protein [Pedobacter sp.]HMI03044.1 RNA-binding protein [Pedobacter sp.]